MSAATGTQPPAQSAPGRRRRRAGRILVAGSVLLVLTGLFGAWNPGSFIWVGRLFDHPFAFGVVAVLAMSAGVSLLGPRWVRLPCWISGIAVAVLWGLAGSMFSGLGPRVARVVPAPDGEGPAYELVVRDAGIVDPYWVLSIRTTGTLLAREWRFACIGDDGLWNRPSDAVWRGRDHLVLRSMHMGSVTIAVDRHTGRPQPVRRGDWSCSADASD